MGPKEEEEEEKVSWTWSICTGSGPTISVLPRASVDVGSLNFSRKMDDPSPFGVQRPKTSENIAGMEHPNG